MADKLSISFFRTIFDILPDPILIIDKSNFEITLCNLEAQNLLKKSNDYLCGKKLDQIFSKELIILSSLNEIKGKTGIFNIKDKLKIESNYFEIQCLLSEEVDQKLILILRKIEKKNSVDYNRNLDYLNEIFSILSHEVNNPISSIRLASDLIKKRYTNVDQELLQIIKSEALRITRLFANFNLSEFNSIKMKTNENIHELIRLSLFKIKQMPNNITFIEEFDPSLPLIKINKDLIIQAFDNILNNAYESSNFLDNSFIKIQTRFISGETIKIPNIRNFIKKNSIRIIVSENGIGIPETMLKKIFLPFFSTKKRGSGIGLFLVKKIIDDHEGTINIESKDGVTSVIITLPF